MAKDFVTTVRERRSSAVPVDLEVEYHFEQEIALTLGWIDPICCSLAQSYIQATSPDGTLHVVSFGMKLVSMGEAGWGEAALTISQSVIQVMIPQLRQQYPDHTFVGKIKRT